MSLQTRPVTITKLCVVSRRGSNGIPSFGTAWFSDGKAYTFLLHPLTGEYCLSSHRKNCGGAWESFGFRSPKRSAAVTAYVNQ